MRETAEGGSVARPEAREATSAAAAAATASAAAAAAIDEAADARALLEEVGETAVVPRRKNVHRRGDAQDAPPRRESS